MILDVGIDHQRMRALGLMSGTSMDGLDMALVDIRPSSPTVSLVAFDTSPYPAQLKKAIQQAVSDPHQSVSALSRLNFFLGSHFAETAKAFLRDRNIPTEEVAFIASHGQTICHQPEKSGEGHVNVPATLQIGDPGILATQTGVLTIGDFRIADMANGGQGAPLMPFFDFNFMRDKKKSQIYLNIGGIANLCALKQGCPVEDVVAFDTGPGNMLLDHLSNDFFSKPYDEGGLLGGQGRNQEALLLRLLEQPFFARKPPKSADRQVLMTQLVATIGEFTDQTDMTGQDLLATAAELTAKSIYQACQNFLDKNAKWDELIISGGGAKNGHLMACLKHYFVETQVMTSDELGVPVDAKEAICMATMGYYTLRGLANNIPAATGAKRSAVLGKICLPNPERANNRIGK